MKRFIACLVLLASLRGTTCAKQPEYTCAELLAQVETSNLWISYWDGKIEGGKQRLSDLQGQYATLIYFIMTQGSPPSPGQIQSMQVLTDAMSATRLFIKDAEQQKATWMTSLTYWQGKYYAQGC